MLGVGNRCCGHYIKNKIVFISHLSNCLYFKPYLNLLYFTFIFLSCAFLHHLMRFLNYFVWLYFHRSITLSLSQFTILSWSPIFLTQLTASSRSGIYCHFYRNGRDPAPVYAIQYLQASIILMREVRACVLTLEGGIQIPSNWRNGCHLDVPHILILSILSSVLFCSPLLSFSLLSPLLSSTLLSSYLLSHKDGNRSSPHTNSLTQLLTAGTYPYLRYKLKCIFSCNINPFSKMLYLTPNHSLSF